MTDIPAPEKRKPLTKAERAQLVLRQGGKCPQCGAKVGPDDWDEHVHALFQGGSNDLSNREIWCRSCAQKKTSEIDARANAKIRRLQGLCGQQARRKSKPGPLSKNSPSYQRAKALKDKRKKEEMGYE
ncbi:MAG: HNH endonuclease signature motif containing protein [Pseudomonadota bacterium]